MDVLALDLLPAEYRVDYNALSAVGGTWQGDETGRAVVRYDPNMTNHPLAFLSMLVHELLHHRLHMTPLDMPGGPEAEELATDLHCITTGFGVISMAGAEQVGWQGYMRQDTRGFALALFCALRGDDGLEHLTPRAARMVRRAARFVARELGELPGLRRALENAPARSGA